MASSTGLSTSQETIDVSMYMPTPQPKLPKLNEFITLASDGRVSPIRAQMNQPVDQYADRTQRYFRKKVNECIDVVLDCIAPGQSSELKTLLGTPETTEETEDLKSILIHIYEEADSWYTKRQVLSIFVNRYTKSELKQLIPGLTTWRIDEARRHASLVGPGKLVELRPISRTRLDMKKVDHFVEFASSPLFLQDVAYGTKHLKLTTGEKLEIPGVVRTLISSRLISMYQSYCSEIGYEPLGRSTLYTILQV